MANAHTAHGRLMLDTPTRQCLTNRTSRRGCNRRRAISTDPKTSPETNLSSHNERVNLLAERAWNVPLIPGVTLKKDMDANPRQSKFAVELSFITAVGDDTASDSKVTRTLKRVLSTRADLVVADDDAEANWARLETL